MVRSNDVESMLETVWNALHGYRQTCIPEGIIFKICKALTTRN